jgi:hypothetical protein
VALFIHSKPQRFDRVRLVIGLIVPLVLIVALTVACGDDEVDPRASATTSTPMTTSTTTTSLPSVGNTDEPQGDDEPECDQRSIKGLVDDTLGSGDGPEIDRVEVTECAGGYARVIVIPVEPNFETEQLFLRLVGDTWEILDFGTGISCEDDDLSEDLDTACEALGLS